ncbi:MAG: hypothetical protein ABIQ81_02790 [Novosphingobium sp.]
MTDRDRQAETEHNPDLAPELTGDEQEEESSQAQSVADEAMDRTTSVFGLDESEKVSTGDDSDDVQDLVDHMNQMATSGRIDMSAYRGERNDDEEEGRYGDGAEEE